MGVGRSVDNWRLVAEREVSPAVVVVRLPVADPRARASDQIMMMLRHSSRNRLLNDSI